MTGLGTARQPCGCDVFSRLVAGEADDLWIVCFALPGVERGRAILLGERGVPVVSIELPTGLQLEQVDRHGIVGIERDVNGNEYVVAYAFQPPVAIPR